MSIESDAKAIFDVVNGYFKDSLKSVNKTYSSDLAKTDPKVAEKYAMIMKRRDTYLSRPVRPLEAFRTKYLFKTIEMEVKGGSFDLAVEKVKVLIQHYKDDPGVKAGNCGEMCLIALARAFNAKLDWDTSIVKIGDNNINHAFCCIGDMSPFKQMKFDMLKEVQMDPLTMPWVVDSWARCCCPLNEYPNVLRQKMAKWFGDGKRIIVPGQPGTEPRAIMPLIFLYRCLQASDRIEVVSRLGDITHYESILSS